MTTRIRSTTPTAGSPRSTGAPIFLVGPARSGTSLLYKVLCLHEHASYVSNWTARFPRRPALASLDRVARHMPAMQRRVWFGSDAANAYVYGRRRPLRERVFPMPVEGEPVFAVCGVPSAGEPVDPRAAAASLRRTVSRIGAASGGSVFVNKRIANIRRIPFLAEAFPGARFVALVRDGRAVATSLSTVDWWPDHHVEWYGGTPTQWAEAGGDPWELCARNWVEELEVMEAGLAQVTPDQVLRLTYEDLIQDPVPQLERIARFGGLDPTPDWRQRVGALSFPNRNERWRTALDDEALRTVLRAQESTLKEYGYET